jgi:transcriptional regulator with XRE-family HTH domain
VFPTNPNLMRRKRRWLDRSTADVAAEAGIAEGTLRNIESGRCEVSERVLGRLARILELDIAEVTGDEDNAGVA